VLHLRVHGKGGKLRYLPLHPGTAELVTDYLELAGHWGETGGALREARGGEYREVWRALTAGHGAATNTRFKAWLHK
jgi:integrase/recombinase XerD